MAASAMVSLGLLILLGSLATLADANSFRGREQRQNDTAFLSAEAEQALLVGLEAALGSGLRHATEKRLKRLEQLISPKFEAMSKNENGKLGPAAAGYVLHRVFVERHGWFIKALEPAGSGLAAWNSSKPISILEERVPEHVQSLFERRLGEHGLGVKELSILAATLEHLIHTEALERLKISYLALGLSQEDELSEEDVTEAVDVYMSIFVFGGLHSNLTTLTPEMARSIKNKALQNYPASPETQEFTREVYRSVAPNRDYMFFNEVENVISEIGEQYGRFQDIECRQFKDLLLAVEDHGVGGAGRVRISDFYGQALNNGHRQFSESVDYLRQLGALDESDASNLRVIIPNYLSSPSNCVASSAYYSVCCLDECEGILGRLELLIAAPQASTSRILSLVPMIPSATMPSNRSLSSWLHHRLEEVATHHGGVVPLHGRLFAQWLHYAYPRECNFPYAAGTIDPQRLEVLNNKDDATSFDLTASETSMKHIVADASPRKNRIPGTPASASEESAMWSMHEELVVCRPPKEPVGDWWFSTHSLKSVDGRAFALLGAAVSLSVALVRSLGPALKGTQKKASEKYYV